jgi:glyoxylase-like metal-dependent hydrolase (beta-lactamase superfamily II)
MDPPKFAIENTAHLAFISTGSVKIPLSLKGQPISNRNVLMRRLRAFTDRNWSDWLPIGAYLIHHPDGPILFDTGESKHCKHPGYVPWYSPTRLVTDMIIREEECIVTQLKSIGVDPKDLKAIVISHLHSDHAGGLEELAKEAPDVPIFIGNAHWEAFGKHPFLASFQGCSPHHWPDSFSPTIMQLEDQPIGPWKQSYTITADRRVIAVDTPGHVPGHISLVVRADNDDGSQTTYFLAGDATYDVQLMDRDEPDGANDDPVLAVESLKMIKAFAKDTDIVVLPSHDPDSPKLLKDRVIYKPTELSRILD